MPFFWDFAVQMRFCFLVGLEVNRVVFGMNEWGRAAQGKHRSLSYRLAYLGFLLPKGCHISPNFLIIVGSEVNDWIEA